MIFRLRDRKSHSSSTILMKSSFTVSVKREEYIYTSINKLRKEKNSTANVKVISTIVNMLFVANIALGVCNYCIFSAFCVAIGLICGKKKSCWTKCALCLLMLSALLC